MRASPLALILDNNATIEDSLITNPNPVNVDCNLVYVNCLRLALKGIDGKSIFDTAKKMAQTAEVISVLEQVEKGEIRDIGKNKGWCALVAITKFNNYSEAINWIVCSQNGTDTDTNACIPGALLGASLGFHKMNQEPQTAHNISIIVTTTENSPTPHPPQYGISDFYKLSQLAHALTR